jgi:CubicO group peptidase (beta-lactamase class C family)
MSPRLPAIDALFERFTNGVQPGCAVGVIRDGALVHAAGFGMADIERAAAIDADTVFNIASTSKQFTAFALLLLARDGRLSLDDSVRKHVPELPAYAEAVTLRQLMHHLGGLRSYIELLLLGGRTFGERTTGEDALRVIARQRGFDDVPGHAFAYSNTGYFLMSLVIERVSGRTLAEFSQAEVFTPLGMTRTRIVDGYPADIPHMSRGYTVADGATKASESAWEQTGDGQVHTTIGDLALWDANFYVPRVGDAQLIAEMLRPGVSSDGHDVGYGGGLFLSRRHGLATVSHGGGWAGYRSELLRFPELRTSVIVLANRDDVDACALAQKVAQAVLDLPAPKQAEPLPYLTGLRAGPSWTAPAPGMYRGSAGQYLRVLQENDGLAIAWGSGKYPLTTRDDGLLQFTAGGDAFIAASYVDDDGRRHFAAQLDDEVADHVAVGDWAPDLAAFAGRYTSEECDGHIELRAEGAGLKVDQFGATRSLHAGAEGDLVTDEGVVLRVPPRAEDGTFVFASWGLRGLSYRRLAPAA